MKKVVIIALFFLGLGFPQVQAQVTNVYSAYSALLLESNASDTQVRDTLALWYDILPVDTALQKARKAQLKTSFQKKFNMSVDQAEVTIPKLQGLIDACNVEKVKLQQTYTVDKTELERALRGLEFDLKDSRSEFAKLQTQYDASTKAGALLKEESAQLRKDLQDAQKESESLKTDVETAKSEGKKAEGGRVGLATDLTTFSTTFNALATSLDTIITLTGQTAPEPTPEEYDAAQKNLSSAYGAYQDAIRQLTEDVPGLSLDNKRLNNLVASQLTIAEEKA
jgi:chromosome segregation ATPase